MNRICVTTVIDDNKSTQDIYDNDGNLGLRAEMPVKAALMQICRNIRGV